MLESEPHTTNLDEEEQTPKKGITIKHLLLFSIFVWVLYSVEDEDDTAPKKVTKQQVTKQQVIKDKPEDKSATLSKKDSAKVIKEQPESSTNIAGNRTQEQMKEVGTTTKKELTSDINIPVKTVEDKRLQDGTQQETKQVVEVGDKNEKNEDDLDNLFEDGIETKDENKEQTAGQTDQIVAQVSEDEKSSLDSSDSSDSSDSDIDTPEGELASDSSEVETSQKLEDSIVDDVIESDTTVPDMGKSIAKSILEDLEVKVQTDSKQEKIHLNLRPVAPPTYEISGRALVYNCVDRHWACIDSKSFNTCKENYKWNASKSQIVECYPVKIYENSDLCEYYQQTNIDNVVETKFCESY